MVDILWNPVKAEEKSILIFECSAFVDSCVITSFDFFNYV